MGLGVAPLLLNDHLVDFGIEDPLLFLDPRLLLLRGLLVGKYAALACRREAGRHPRARSQRPTTTLALLAQLLGLQDDDLGQQVEVAGPSRNPLVVQVLLRHDDLLVEELLVSALFLLPAEHTIEINSQQAVKLSVAGGSNLIDTKWLG